MHKYTTAITTGVPINSDAAKLLQADKLHHTNK